MSFLGKANFCGSGQSHLWQRCHVIQNDVLNVCHSPAHLFSPFHFCDSALYQLWWLSQQEQSPVPLQSPLQDVVILTDATPTNWAFYFQGSGLPFSMSSPWSGSVHRVHIVVQELQAISLMLHRMTFQLSGKVVAFQLGSSTAKAYLCKQGDTLSLFFPDLAATYWI